MPPFLKWFPPTPVCMSAAGSLGGGDHRHRPRSQRLSEGYFAGRAQGGTDFSGRQLQGSANPDVTRSHSGWWVVDGWKLRRVTAV